MQRPARPSQQKQPCQLGAEGCPAWCPVSWLLRQPLPEEAKRHFPSALSLSLVALWFRDFVSQKFCFETFAGFFSSFYDVAQLLLKKCNFSRTRASQDSELHVLNTSFHFGCAVCLFHLCIAEHEHQ